MRQKASIGKIVKNDYAAFVMAIAGPIFCAVCALATGIGIVVARTWRTDPGFALGLGIAAAGVSAASMLLLAGRVRRIRRVFAAGAYSVAIVTGVWFYRDRGRVEFEYVHDGRRYHAGTAVMKCGETKRLTPGLEVEVAVDPARPGRAYIVPLYSQARADAA